MVPLTVNLTDKLDNADHKKTTVKKLVIIMPDSKTTLRTVSKPFIPKEDIFVDQKDNTIKNVHICNISETSLQIYIPLTLKESRSNSGLLVDLMSKLYLLCFR